MFAIVPLTTRNRELLIRSELPRVGLRHRVLHVQLADRGAIRFAAYDCFHRDCVWADEAVPEQTLQRLLAEGSIRQLVRADHPSTRPPQRPPRWCIALLFLVAAPLTFIAVLLTVMTFATNDFTKILVAAVSCAVGSMLALLLVARRLPRPGRWLALCVAGVDAWVVWAAGARLLGW